jgi:hypothetical protein
VKPGKKYQTKRAVLLLADGTRFDGEGLGAAATALGEAVFYTGMTGYEEAMTDPSYAGQILTFTYPLIGNYGVSRTVSQHPHATVAGCVIKHISNRPSHFENVIDLGSWLEEQKIPTIVGVDTRALTIALREHGTIAAALAVGDEAVANVDATLADYVRTMTTSGLVARVERTRRCFGVELDRGDRQGPVTEPLVRPVVEVDHRRFEMIGQRRAVDRVPVVVGGDQHFVVQHVLDGLIAAAMAVGQLERLRAARKRQELMAQTHAEHRGPADQAAQRFHRVRQLARIAGPR